MSKVQRAQTITLHGEGLLEQQISIKIQVSMTVFHPDGQTLMGWLV